MTSLKDLFKGFFSKPDKPEAGATRRADPLFSGIPPEVLNHQQSSWIPEVEGPANAVKASKFGGLPTLGPEEPWPACGNCAQPMQLFLQLSSEELPLGLSSPFGNGLLQLFYCTSMDPHCEIDTEAWSPFGESTLARVLPLEAQAQAVGSSLSIRPFPERTIREWRQAVDLPNGEELRAMGITLAYETSDLMEERGIPRDGEKLLGWPAWVQGLEYPACPQCAQRMNFLFQIDSEKNIPYMFGDAGIAHLFVCPSHRDALAFGWACC